jgi:hypothetical protein
LPYRLWVLDFQIGLLSKLSRHIPDPRGILYLFNSFAVFLAPEFENVIFPAIVLPAGLAELSFCLWLIVMGVNVPKWEMKANRLAS